MTNVLRSVAGVLLVGLMSPSLVYADPVTITSGVWTGGLYSERFSGSLSGIDASGQSSPLKVSDQPGGYRASY